MRWRLLLLACVACGNGSVPPVPSNLLTAEESARLRAACTFRQGAKVADTLANTTPRDAELPVDHIVLLMQENRSFDHYFSQLSHGGVRVAPAGATNPDAAGNPVARYHETRYCLRDLDHSWAGSHAQYDDGKNDGFVITNGADGARSLAYYDESDLPWYYAVARTFAISDAHFASVMGPTFPNRLFYMAARSFGLLDNGVPPVNDPSGKPYPNLFTRLDDAKVPWRVYSQNLASPALFLDLLQNDFDKFRSMDDFYLDLQEGTLPPVAVVEALYGDGAPGVVETDEHPAGNIQRGQAFTAQAVEAVMRSSAWPRSVIFLSYDEHGGFYDSVPPPQHVCAPDDIPPQGDPARKFDHFGFRTPLIAISPYARRGYVSHEVVDHTAVIRFVSARFGLPALSARDANSTALMDLFDFNHPDAEVPALPEAVIDPVRDAQCKVDFP